MTPVEQRLLFKEIEKQIALLQTRLRTLGDSEQKELKSLKQLLQTLVESKKEEEKQRKQATPYQTFCRAMDELVEQRNNNIFVQKLPHLIANFCTSASC
jgi:sulfatase maturation enzyme AslB (radical SAM superfamily)